MKRHSTQLSRTANIQFLLEVLAMRIDGMSAEVQLLGNRSRRHALSD